MPYYCTVPRCTSLAGKAKDVSFHQFPRDKELAEKWNVILKRGKPYTKYSKVCSLHFKPEDFCLSRIGDAPLQKCKGSWKTLRKDAIPSRNLPGDYEDETGPKRRRSSNTTDSQDSMNEAMATYLKTVVAFNMAVATQCRLTESTQNENIQTSSPLICEQCQKYFKDPDVFSLHMRMHSKGKITSRVDVSQDTQLECRNIENHSGNIENGSMNHDDDAASTEDQDLKKLMQRKMTEEFLMKNLILQAPDENLSGKSECGLGSGKKKMSIFDKLFFSKLNQSFQ